MDILIVYHSRLGSVHKLARLIARGVESIENCNAVLRTVPEISVSADAIDNDTSNDKPADQLVELAELKSCDGLIIGSPTRFGNMSASMKQFVDDTSGLWLSGDLSGKPAAVFTSTSSMHGGQEATLLSMIVPLLHHGMLICGLPYTEPALSRTTSGGTPYGASHVAGPANNNPISEDERTLCLALGKRVAKAAVAMAEI